MRSVQRTASRAERLREYEAALEQAGAQVAALGVLVRAREARPSDRPLEVDFAASEVDGRALPAGVWVALRGDGVESALSAMLEASQREFVVEQRETVGEGFRLETVEDTRPLPEVDLLVAQLALMLDVPHDVLTVLAGWGADDPRTASEVERLLTSRYGPSEQQVPTVPAPAPAPAAAPAAPTPVTTRALTLTVEDAAEVLQLTDTQRTALNTLVRHTAVTVVPGR